MVYMMNESIQLIIIINDRGVKKEDKRTIIKIKQKSGRVQQKEGQIRIDNKGFAGVERETKRNIVGIAIT